MRILLLALLTAFFTGCMSKPTQTTTVVDDRPRITFQAELAAKPETYAVYIDGVAYGTLDQFLANESALRIISGRHQIHITHNGNVIKTYDITLGANETRVLKVTHGQ